VTPRLSTAQKITTFVLLLGGAAYYVLVELHKPGRPAHDTYAYFLPNAVHFARSVWQGGKGLFWNPFQAGGGPFFANGVGAGVLNPQYLPFLVLEANAALHVVLILDMVLGAIGMFLLVRHFGVGWVAALGGALAFQLGDPMAQFAGWNPMVAGAWAWLPWAILGCERLLRAPSRGGVVALAAVLTLQLLTGLMQIVALTYQLIALRVGWEILTRRAVRSWHPLLAVAAALALPPLLVAVQLLPYIEFARVSFRATIAADELVGLRTLPLSQYLRTTALRLPPVPFMAALLLLAAVAPFVAAARRRVLFYLAIGLLYAVLALGPLTPLFSLYVRLPPGGVVLNVPYRLFWISGFCLALLAAFGLDELAKAANHPRLRWGVLFVVALVAVALLAFAPGGLRWTEIAAVAAIVAGAAGRSIRPEIGRPAAWVAVAALAFNLLAVPVRWAEALLPSLDGPRTHAATFAALGPLGAQERVFLMPPILQVNFTPRTATLLAVPSFSEYEVLPSDRYVQYLTMMRKGVPAGSIAATDWMPWLRPGVRRRLIDAASIRYLIAVARMDSVAGLLDLPQVPVPAGDLRAYRNEQALPRARYVPRIEVIPDHLALLQRLGYGEEDLTAVALVEEAPVSAFTGVPGTRPGGEARFIINDPEHLVIEVDAPERGFLIVADTHYAGWRATVNGDAAPILRANYLFRLVEVPSGRSRVEFRYRPAYFELGAVISASTLAVLAVVLLRRRTSRRDHQHPPPPGGLPTETPEPSPPATPAERQAVAQGG
jgi:hypothetical protein